MLLRKLITPIWSHHFTKTEKNLQHLFRISPHMVRAIGLLNMTSFISQKHRYCIAKENKRLQFTHERDVSWDSSAALQPRPTFENILYSGSFNIFSLIQNLWTLVCLLHFSVTSPIVVCLSSAQFASNFFNLAMSFLHGSPEVTNVF
jgi:hypothetical protein